MTDTEFGARSAWIITDGKAGMDVQCIGVADALGVAYEMKRVEPGALWQLLAPWFGPAPGERVGKSGSAFAPPWPDLVIATGRQAIPYLTAVRKASKGQCFTVVLQDPKTGVGTADLIWVPEHDRLRGKNVITTLTPAHSFTQTRIEALRAAVPAEIAALPGPRVMLALGGPNSVYRYCDKTISRLAGAVCDIAKEDVSFLVTPSRRSPDSLAAAMEEATRPRPRLLWQGDGDNPYADFLSNADIIIATADSVNMVGEACATGRPVYVFEPEGGSPKFSRFHEALRRYGATRTLPVRFDHLESWTYAPLDSAARIAAEIKARWGATRSPRSAMQRG